MGPTKNFGRRVLHTVLLCFTLSASAFAQVTPHQPDYVAIPNDVVLSVIASQPDAPIRFQDVTLLMTEDGKDLAIAYNVRNTSKKPIRYLTPVVWTSYDTGGTLTPVATKSETLLETMILPGQLVEKQVFNKIVSPAPDVLARLKSIIGKKPMVVLMVKNVMFADGTQFTDDVTFKSIQSYFEDLNYKLSRLEVLEQKRP
jgi:fumarate reductase subunit D